MVTTRVHGLDRILPDDLGQKNTHNMLNIMGKNIFEDWKIFLFGGGGGS